MHVYSLHKQIRHDYSFDHNSAKWSHLGLHHHLAPILHVMPDSSSWPRVAPSPPRSRICRPFAGSGASPRCRSTGRKPSRGPDSALLRTGLVFITEGEDKRPHRGALPHHLPARTQTFQNRTPEFLQRMLAPQINLMEWKRQWLYCLTLWPVFLSFHSLMRHRANIKAEE